MISVPVIAQCLTLSSALSRRGMTIWLSRRWFDGGYE